MRKRKQLYVLLAAPAWVSLVVLIAYIDYAATTDLKVGGGGWPQPSPGEWVFQAFALSLPAVLLGAILFWWFGKDRVEK